MDNLNWDPVLNPDSDNVAGSERLVPDSTDDAVSNLAKSLNMELNDDTKDYLYEYYLNEHSAENSWKRQLDYDNTRYQRAVEDLKKAGLNPFLAIQSLSAGSSSSPTSSVSGGYSLQRKNAQLNANTQTANNIRSGIFGILGIIAMAVISVL